MCASLEGVVKPVGAMKVKVNIGCPRREACPRSGGLHRRPVPGATSPGRRVSIHVGTRKMVNYA